MKKLATRRFIVELAERHGVNYTKTPADNLADIFSRLSDKDVEYDETELLLLALERAGVIPSEEVLPLHVKYLREKFNSDSEDERSNKPTSR